MPYTIVQEICIQCGSCSPFCKKEAIDWIDHQYVIDPERCEMCGTCIEYCPMDNTIIDSRTAGDKPLHSHLHHN